MTASNTLLLLLRAADQSAVSELEHQSAQIVDPSRTPLPAECSVACALSLANHLDRVAELIEDPQQFVDILAHGMPPTEMPVDAKSFDVVLTVRFPTNEDSALVAAAAGTLSEHLSGLYDRSQSSAVVGSEHVIMDGPGAMEMYYCIARRPDMSHEAFSDFWLNTFTAHSRLTPGKAGYHQLHADPSATRAAARVTGVALDDFDGVAMEWFADLNEFLKADAHGRATSGAGAAFMDGERSMNDFARARSMLGFSVSGPGQSR